MGCSYHPKESSSAVIQVQPGSLQQLTGLLHLPLILAPQRLQSLHRCLDLIQATLGAGPLSLHPGHTAFQRPARGW